ncbi:MAG: hypothetical protein KGJ13_13240, partial [Patescibacteria group bacterium]|nr:hypothetical protein [Patescibacteria group bacterium]
MQLEYIAHTRAFVLSVPRADSVLVSSLVQEHGWNFSQSVSTAEEAKLFTKEPYAAVEFAGCAVNGAAERLHPLVSAIAASRQETSDVQIPVPPDRELWPFQRASVEYALSRNRVLCGDQPGLGKTPIAICFANALRAKRVLVVCPANIRLQWGTRIREWTTMPRPHLVYPVLSGKNGVHPSAEWTVVSYDLARTEAIGKALARGRYDLLILDEAHYLKSADAERTQAIFGDHSGAFRKLVRTNGRHEYDEWFPALASRCG